MNSRASKARWTASLAAAAALLLTGTAAGTATADPAPSPQNGTSVGWRALGLAPSPEGTKAYVVAADRNGSRTPVVLRTVDLHSGSVVAELPLAEDGTAGNPVVSQDGRRLYVIVANHLVAVDTAANTVLSRTPAPEQDRPAGWSPGVLTGLAVSPDGSKVYVGQNGPLAVGQGVRPGRVLVFGPGQGAFTGSLALHGYNASGLTLQAGGAAAYVGSDAGIEHLDTTTAIPTFLRTVQRVGATKELAASPDGLRLYALGAQTSTGTGYAVNTLTDVARPIFTFANGPVDLHYVAVSPDSGRLYLLKDSWTPQASVLAYDTATDANLPGETLTGFGLDGVSATAVAPGGHTLLLAGIRGDGSYLKTVAF
ncbi:YncE family protein [Kitasatospora sp. NPDC056184]|uniref:YncE family protein n=1 Tax=Kitasatospora sp. NPDC056184 TaxID=3345738 RepID=UPI0035DB9FBD